ncbi:cyclic pyranopterin monophosphate synthase MoaC [Candidatus Bathyarchaeota archaeon]|nr:MAG: cyclic pyranopterin monophosphate synthase MoaC [Candidatus Bathyarchaeota archaeon]
MVEEEVSMVDITSKPPVYREASVRGLIKLKPQTINLIREGKIKKGNPFETAKIAGILAAKNTSQIIPLCHPIPLTHVDIQTRIVDTEKIEVFTTVKTEAKTGVEMEALTATATALLTIFDMVKQYEKDEEGQYPATEILSLKVESKTKKSSS